MTTARPCPSLKISTAVVVVLTVMVTLIVVRPRNGGCGNDGGGRCRGGRCEGGVNDHDDIDDDNNHHSIRTEFLSK